MEPEEWTPLKRDCPATEIPSGRPTTLYAGTEIRISQCLGGTFTVMTHQGAMVSISGREADALGKEVPEEARAPAGEGALEDQVWQKLKTCYDPEIPHNIVDLGLIYHCAVTALEDGKNKVEIRMTLTAPGCGMGDWLRQDIRNKLQALPAVGEVNVELVFEPPWTPEKMNKSLRRALNL